MAKKNSTFKAKWGEAIENEGYVQVPNLLIRHLGDLNITPVEFAVIVSLLSHMWTENNPFPAVDTIASYIGRSRNTAQAAARNLDFNKGHGKGLVLRIARGNKTNEYDIRPLVKRVKSYAQPIEKLIPDYRETDNLSYREIDTEEEALKKTKIIKRNGSCGKLTQAGEILKHEHPDIAIK